MDEKKEYQAEEYRTNMNYGDLIIEMVHNINDTWILKQVYRYIKNITREG